MAQFGSVESLRGLVWHEFGHSFVNPEVERLSASLEKSSKLMNPIAAKMRASAYQQWQTVVIEHVDRAVAARLAFRELGEDAGEQALAKEEASSFAYVGALAERLKEYEQHRDRYPTFRDFAPRLIATLPNPQNPKLWAVAYTATDASAVADINRLFAGPTAYVIGKGTEVLKSGDYRRQGEGWILK